MDTVQVQLTRAEVEAVSPMAVSRFIGGIFADVEGRRWKGEFVSFDHLMESLLAEYSVAKYLGMHFNPDNVGGSDIFVEQLNLNIEVKHTKMDNGRLCIRDRDRDNALYVLVTGSCPTYRIQGWVRGIHAKEPKWMEKGLNGRIYMVPQHELIAVGDLKRLIYEHIYKNITQTHSYEQA